MRKYNLSSVMLGNEGHNVNTAEGKDLYIDEIGILHIRQPGADLEQLEPPNRWYQALTALESDQNARVDRLEPQRDAKPKLRERGNPR